MKRILVLFTALTLCTSSIDWTFAEDFAAKRQGAVTSYSDVIREEGGAEDNVYVDFTAWESFENFLDSFEGATYQITDENGLSLAVSKDGAINFKAERENESIELILSNTVNECQVVYTDGKNVIAGKQQADTLTDKLTFEAKELENASFDAMSANAEKLFSEAMLAWDKAISGYGFSLSDFGFIAWDVYFGSNVATGNSVNEEMAEEGAEDVLEESTGDVSGEGFEGDELADTDASNSEENEDSDTESVVDEQTDADVDDAGADGEDTASDVDDEDADDADKDDAEDGEDAEDADKDDADDGEGVDSENIDSDSDVDDEDADVFDSDDEDADGADEDADDVVADDVVSDEVEEDNEAADSDAEVQIEDEATDEEETVSENAMDSTMILPETQRITTNYKTINMQVGETRQLYATVYPQNSSQPLTWKVSAFDSQYVTVYSSGEIKAKKQTPMPVKVTAQSGSILCEVEVVVSSNYIWDSYDEFGNPTYEYENYEKIPLNDGIWIGGFNKTGLTYTGKVVKQQLTVYCGGKTLVEGVDYLLTYTNSVNVCEYSDANPACVTVKMRGKYAGKATLYYSIRKRNIYDVTFSNNMAINYNGLQRNYTPTVSYNGKALVKGVDFTISYNETERVGTKGSKSSFSYTLHGIGNYTGDVVGEFYIVDKQYNISKATVRCKPECVFTGFGMLEDDILNSIKLRMEFPGSTTVVYPALDTANFEVYMELPYTTGQAIIHIIGKSSGDYCGEITKTFNMVAQYSLADVAEVNDKFVEKVTYRKGNNVNIQPDTGLALINKATGYEIDPYYYYTTYKENNMLGTATIVFHGMGQYKGKYKKTFKIVNPTPNFVVKYADPSAEFHIGGATINLEVENEGQDYYGYSYSDKLVEGVDYEVQYTKNKNIGTATYKIVGINNYKKQTPISGTFNVLQTDISLCTVKVADKAYTGVKGQFKSVPEVVDVNGKALVAGVDYVKKINYLYDDCDDPSSIYYNNPKAGSQIVVEISGIGKYYGTAKGYYKLYDSTHYGMNKLFISIDDQVYTGSPIELDVDKDIHVYGKKADRLNKTNELTPASDYVRIISYKANQNPGEATVVLGGAVDSEYGGKKACVFNIVKKKYVYTPVTDIILSDTSMILTSTTEYATATITAAVNPSNANNKNLVWESSDESAVKIISSDNESCKIQAAGEGSANITVTSLDTGVEASCYVISKSYILEGIELNHENIFLTNSAGSYTLKASVVPYTADVGTLSWSSSDTSVVTVDTNGKLTINGTGRATVTVSAKGKSASCNVTIGSGAMGLFDFTVSEPEWNLRGATPNDDISDNNAMQSFTKFFRDTCPVGNGSLYIPAGVYDFYSNIDLAKLHDVTIVMHPDAVLKFSSSMGIDISSSSNITIRGGNIDISSYAGYSEAVVIRNSSDIKLEGVNIVSGCKVGINIFDLYGTACENINISNGVIRGVSLDAVRIQSADGVTFENMLFADSAGSAVTLDSSSDGVLQCNNINLNNCIFENNKEYDFTTNKVLGLSSTINVDGITFDGCSFSSGINILYGTNYVFKNTKKKPSSYRNEVTNSSVYPD